MNKQMAIMFTLLAALAFSVMALFVKMAAANTSNNVIILFRFGVSFIYILLVFLIKRWHGYVFKYKTQHITLHLIRAVFSVSAMLLFYYSLKYITLIDGNLLIMTNALFIPIIAAIIWQVSTSKKHWLTVILGFIGVALVLKPGHELFHPASIIALGAGLASAFALITIRQLSKYDSPHTSMLYYFPLAFLISGAISVFHWQTPNLHILTLLLIVGISGTCYQEFLIRATYYGSTKIVAPLMYTSLIFSGLFGWFIWGERPDLFSWLGIILICTGSIFTVIFTER